MNVKPIRSDADYQAQLDRVEQLIDAEAGTPEADELEVRSALIERYEDEMFGVFAPTPLAAIHFRMEQGGLTSRQLEAALGSRTRVSEVLSGSRSLSIDMIRALNSHFGIPAESLIQPEPLRTAKAAAQLSKPVEHKLKLWNILEAGEKLDDLLARAFGGKAAVALRKTRTERTNAKTDVVALQAWCAAAAIKSCDQTVLGVFDRSTITPDTARGLARLSRLPDGPIKAREALSELGVALVVLQHLPGTHLDGAAMYRADGTPTIALTLRRDRIDYFWFTLLHEFAHVARHLSDDRLTIVDDLEISSSEDIEKEADQMAQDALIDPALWAKVPGTYARLADIERIADRAEVHSAIVAGRWQRENHDFRKFSKELGHNEVRSLFPEFSQ